MPYIPGEWVMHEKNQSEIDYIMQYLDQDLITTEIAAEMERLTKRLKEIGEDILYDKVTSSNLSFSP